MLTDCPILEESPVNLECKVTQVIPLGSHDLFLAEVVACDVDESLLDENGKLCLEKGKAHRLQSRRLSGSGPEAGHLWLQRAQEKSR